MYVYQTSGRYCNAVYVSETARSVRTRKLEHVDAVKTFNTQKNRAESTSYGFIYAYELMLCLHVLRQTGPPRRLDYSALPSVYHVKIGKFR